MTPFWKSLLDGKFISKKKYDRLVRHSELDANELSGFIERQLVETRQGTKVVAEILKSALPNTEIIYAKARPVADFRKDFGFIKVRDMNDLHHAKDAYLNIVVGNTYFVKFTKNAAWFIKENPGRTYNLKRMFTSGDVVRNGDVAWKSGENGTLKTVEKYMNKNNILVTRKSYEVTGALFDQMLMKKGKGQVPVKSSDERLRSIEKYGGYNKAAGTYFMLVKSLDKKGNEMRTIEYIPLYLKQQIESDSEICKQYLTEDRNLKDPVVLLPKIKIDTLFKVDGFKMWLSGRTENRLLFKNANQLLLDRKEVEVLKKVVKYCNRLKEVKDLKIAEKDEIRNDELIKLYETLLGKIKNTIYNVRLSAQVSTLENKKDVFMNIPREEKCIVLYEILHMFQCQSTCADLKLIGGPGKAGILVMSNNITKFKQISIINQSPTGVYEKEIDLLTV